MSVREQRRQLQRSLALFANSNTPEQVLPELEALKVSVQGHIEKLSLARSRTHAPTAKEETPQKAPSAEESPTAHAQTEQEADAQTSAPDKSSLRSVRGRRKSQ